jgi:hypothetical protein
VSGAGNDEKRGLNAEDAEEERRVRREEKTEKAA